MIGQCKSIFGGTAVAVLSYGVTRWELRSHTKKSYYCLFGFHRKKYSWCDSLKGSEEQKGNVTIYELMNRIESVMGWWFLMHAPIVCKSFYIRFTYVFPACLHIVCLSIISGKNAMLLKLKRRFLQYLSQAWLSLWRETSRHVMAKLKDKHVKLWRRFLLHPNLQTSYLCCFCVQYF